MKLVLLVGWIFLILAGYYLFHKPVTPDQALAIGQAVLDCGLAILIIVSAGGIGHRLLKRFQLGGLAGAATACAAGLGIMGMIWLGLGAAHLVYPIGGWVVLVFTLILFRKEAVGWIKDLGEIKSIWAGSRSFDRFLGFSAGLMVLFQVATALAPPLKWDALTYHLALPQQYLTAHTTTFGTTNPYSGSPQLGEMLFTWASALHRPETAAMLALVAGVVFLLGILGLARSTAQSLLPVEFPEKEQSLPVSAGWVAVLAILAGYTFRHMLGWSYTDLFSALFGLSTLVLLFSWYQLGDDRKWLWIGAMCGWAVSIKYPSGAAAAAVFIIPILFYKYRKLSWKIWGLAALTAILVFLPWPFRDFLATGNPIFPFIFPTPGFTAWRLGAANTPPSELNWLTSLSLPVSMTWIGVENAGGFGTDIGPLLVLLCAPALIKFRRCWQAWFCGAILGITWLAIGVLGLKLGHLSQPRLYFASLAAAAVLAGLGWVVIQSFSFRGIRLRQFASVLVGLVCVFVLIQDGAELVSSGAAGVVTGSESREAYLAANIGWYSTLSSKVSSFPPGAMGLALWEPRNFYLPASVEPDYWVDRWRVDAHEYSSIQDIMASWRNRGISYILVNKAGEGLMRQVDRTISAQDWEKFDRLISQLQKTADIGGQYQIYTLP